MQNNSIQQHQSSYRDPSGYIFEKTGSLYRQVNISYKEHFDFFINTGCYDSLTKKGLLIPHETISENLSGDPNWYTTLKPEKIDFITYPYEWSFGILKSAALLTLQVAREALSFDMILKDATPYNIQWQNGKLVFIDSLSFEKFYEKPWIAYRQFCEALLSPLLLMHYGKEQSTGWLLGWPEGIPLPITSSLLPRRSRFSLYTYLHIHLHAKYSSGQKGNPSRQLFSKQKLINLISSLESLVKGLRMPPKKSIWSGYYDEAYQREDYVEEKKKLIAEWSGKIPNCKTAIDLGSNEGELSKILAVKKCKVIATDFDPYCIDRLYKWITETKEKNIQPIVLDLAHPSPAIGVNNEERNSFIDRSNFDLALALALIHHLVIGRNIPFEMVADTFSRIGQHLIIEFVPKDDPKVKLMLEQKNDIYTNYSENNFTSAFEKYFSIIDKKNISDSGRTLFLMQKKTNER